MKIEFLENEFGFVGAVEFDESCLSGSTNAGEACTITTGSIDLSRFVLDEQEGV